MDAEENPETVADYKAKIKSMTGLFDEMKIAICYLRFDVEATVRERDAWKKKAGGK